MTMNWQSLIELLIAFIGGGGLASLIMIKVQRRSAEADVEAKVSEEWRKLYEEMKQKADKVDEMWHDLVKLQGTVSKIQMELAVANSMRCEILNCPKRKKPRPIKAQDTDYDDLHDIDQNINGEK